MPGFTLLAVDSKGNVHPMVRVANNEPYLPSMQDDWLTKPSIGEMRIKAAIERLKEQAASEKARSTRAKVA